MNLKIELRQGVARTSNWKLPQFNEVRRHNEGCCSNRLNAQNLDRLWYGERSSNNRRPWITKQKPEVAEVNHFVFDGQSLGIGATATTILSTYQPYFNVTFGTGPRMDSAPVSVIPLVEQFNSPASDGGTDRGETPCSGAANYASRAMMLENGINPKDHVIFCSAAGHGGYRIDQLERAQHGMSFYSTMFLKPKD